MKACFLPEAESEHLKQVAYYEAQQAGLGARYLAEVTAALEYICGHRTAFRSLVRRHCVGWA